MNRGKATKSKRSRTQPTHYEHGALRRLVSEKWATATICLREADNSTSSGHTTGRGNGKNATIHGLSRLPAFGILLRRKHHFPTSAIHENWKTYNSHTLQHCRNSRHKSQNSRILTNFDTAQPSSARSRIVNSISDACFSNTYNLKRCTRCHRPVYNNGRYSRRTQHVGIQKYMYKITHGHTSKHLNTMNDVVCRRFVDCPRYEHKCDQNATWNETRQPVTLPWDR